jgi:serine protease Do
MKKRMDKRNEKFRVKKRLFIAVLSFVLVIAAGFGFNNLFLDTESEAGPVVKQSPFTDLAFNDMKINQIESTAEKEEDEIEKTDEPKDVVETEEIKEEIKEEVKEEIIENEVIPVAPPVRDLSLFIANAKAHVYTLYTDLEQGSGFLFNSKGDILTSAHVVKDASYVTVKNNNGQEFNGQVIGISKTVDIALVRVTELSGKQPMEMEMSKVGVGTNVFALGSPENIANSSSEGKITGTGKNFFDEYQYNDLYEMDATIKKGSSGGPLIDADTERILGINSIILTDNPKVGYAIPIYSIVKQLNAWSANPIDNGNWEDDVLQNVKDAYLSEDLLRSFIADYYELIPYSLNDKEIAYYLSFLLPGSQAETEGKKLIEQFAGQDRVFDPVKLSIQQVNVGDSEATVEVSADFSYHDQQKDNVHVLSQQVSYTVVIDEYGDYQIKSIVTK